MICLVAHSLYIRDIHFMRQYSQWFCLGLQIWISEMLQYYPKLEDVELVQDGPRIFWDHLLPSAHVDSFSLYIRDIHLELKVRAP
jgi:hypothetical protein